MKGLRLIRNVHAVRTIVRLKRWPKLAAPIYAEDNQVIARALSILANVEQHDGALTPDQARDVCNWYNKELTK